MDDTRVIPIEQLNGLLFGQMVNETLYGVIAISGIDGSGQNTQRDMLGAYFQRRGRKYWLTAQPREVGIGATIRAILRHQLPDCSEFEIQSMMAEDRGEQMPEIMSHLWEDESVISARWWDDNIVYSWARGLTREQIKSIIRQNAEFPRPEIAIYLDLPVDEAMDRIRKRAEKTGRPLEKFETPECLERVKAGFLRMANLVPNVFIVDATGTEEEVYQRIVAIVEQQLK